MKVFKMRKVIFLIGFCFFVVRIGAAQALVFQGFPADEIQKNNYREGFLYAIKDKDHTKPSGQVVLTPDGAHGWDVSFWIDDLPQSTVSYDADSTTFQMPVDRDGRYVLEATKEGMAPVREEFVVFYVHVPPFQLSLIDPANCQEIKVKLDNFVPVYYNGSYPGMHNVDYYLGREVNGSLEYRTTPVSFNDYPPYQLEISDAVGIREDRNEDAKYIMKIIDRFGLEWESEKADYTSYIPIADMEEPKILNTVKVEGVVGMEAGQAPLEVEFRDKSLNAQAYNWYLYKDTADLYHVGQLLQDSLLDEMIREDKDLNCTYMHPGLYKVQLKVINTQGPYQCWDTTEAKYINVVLSLVNVPNVFTPNGDGKNDIFCAQALSIESFQGVILNRWGRKVCEWSDPLGGWDGRISGKYASPGTYFYIITARGREKNNPPKYVKKGALLLVR